MANGSSSAQNIATCVLMEFLGYIVDTKMVYLANLMGFTTLPKKSPLAFCLPIRLKEQELKQQAARARLEAKAARQVDQSKARMASMSSSEPAGVAGATGSMAGAGPGPGSDLP